jgi:hypothetical protein
VEVKEDDGAVYRASSEIVIAFIYAQTRKRLLKMRKGG